MAEDFSYPADRYILLGKVAKAHGLRGEVKILCYSGQPENFYGYREVVLISGDGRLSPTLTVKSVRIRGKSIVARLATIESRNRAEEIEGHGVLLARDQLPDTAEDEYYWYQYQGKMVVDQSGRVIGRVTNLFNNGAQDILVVDSGQAEILIPVTREIVVKETAEALVVDPPPGLLDLTENSDDSR